MSYLDAVVVGVLVVHSHEVPHSACLFEGARHANPACSTWSFPSRHLQAALYASGLQTNGHCIAVHGCELDVQARYLAVQSLHSGMATHCWQSREHMQPNMLLLAVQTSMSRHRCTKFTLLNSFSTGRTAHQQSMLLASLRQAPMGACRQLPLKKKCVMGCRMHWMR